MSPSPEPIGVWRERLHSARTHIRQNWLDGGSVRQMLRQHSTLIDRLLADIWHHHALPADAVLLAVGGYGRRELFLHSDIDILILLPDNAPPDTVTHIEQLIGALWDIGLETGHSVRTLTDCLTEAENDLTIQTNQLEHHWIAGNRKQFQTFRTASRKHLDPQRFFDGKITEQDQRHARYHDSSSQLEPNLKESPGGLRDLHNLRWLAQATGVGSDWKHFIDAGLLTAEEVRQLRRLESFLFNLRAHLHELAGRREDRLLFTWQTALAERFHLAPQANRRASERLMQRFYRAVRTVEQLRDILLPSLRARVFGNPDLPIVPLNPRFQIRDHLLKSIDDQLFEREPNAILESFYLLQQHPELSGMSASTLRGLWRARRHINHEFRRDPRNQTLFLQLLKTPYAITRTLRELNRYGILGRYIPAFGRIVGQMQYDLYHIYTVDEHTLTVVRNLRRLTIPELSHEFPLASRLINHFDRPDLLYLAALFHDIAKGRGGDHSRLGAIDARRFCQQHHLSATDAELVIWLVREHLSFSSTAQKQDLSDPKVIEHFIARIPNERHLIALYLFTICDIRGTSPTVWNAWKAKLMDELFYACRRRLTNDHGPIGSDITRREAARLLRLYGLSPHTEDALWQQLEDSYFLRHTANEIAWHTRRLWHSPSSGKTIVRARLSPTGAGIQALIYAPDVPGLFARICAFFEKIRYTIVDARIHTTRHHYALDSFTILDPQNQGTTYRDFLSYIEYELTRYLDSNTALPTRTSSRLSRQLKHFPPTAEIQLRPDENGRFHILHLTAGDRPGLLLSIAQIFDRYQIHLHLAKISTMGERAEDTFLIFGDSLTQLPSRTQMERDLLEALTISPLK